MFPVLRLLPPLLISIMFLAACETPSPRSTTFAPTPTSAPNPTSSQFRLPIPGPQVNDQLSRPLASGGSLPDIVEAALSSVVEIQTVTGTGTGFVVSDDGLVITNRHVVGGASHVNLRLPSGHRYSARLLDVHESLDVAYLKITADAGQFIPMSLGDSASVRVGEGVIIIGFPLGSELGQEATVSQGIVSSIRSDMLQTDAPVNPGNSGGPMLNESGQAIGVVFSRVEESQGRQVSGIGFAIPINQALEGL